VLHDFLGGGSLVEVYMKVCMPKVVLFCHRVGGIGSLLSVSLRLCVPASNKSACRAELQP
jgi:hypothetical protein